MSGVMMTVEAIYTDYNPDRQADPPAVLQSPECRPLPVLVFYRDQVPLRVPLAPTTTVKQVSNCSKTDFARRHTSW